MPSDDIDAFSVGVLFDAVYRMLQDSEACTEPHSGSSSSKAGNLCWRIDDKCGPLTELDDFLVSVACAKSRRGCSLALVSVEAFPDKDRCESM